MHLEKTRVKSCFLQLCLIVLNPDCYLEREVNHLASNFALQCRLVKKIDFSLRYMCNLGSEFILVVYNLKSYVAFYSKYPINQADILHFS